MSDKVQATIVALRKLREDMWFDMPAEIERFGRGVQPRGTGAYQQYFTPLMFAEGEARTMSDEVLWCVWQLATDESTDLDTLGRVVSDLVGYKADFLDFVGLPEAAAVFHQFVEAIQAAEGRGEFVELIDAALSYANRFHMWVDAVFPWGIANGFQRPKSTEELKTP